MVSIDDLIESGVFFCRILRFLPLISCVNNIKLGFKIEYVSYKVLLEICRFHPDMSSIAETLQNLLLNPTLFASKVLRNRPLFLKATFPGSLVFQSTPPRNFASTLANSTPPVRLVEKPSPSQEIAQSIVNLYYRTCFHGRTHKTAPKSNPKSSVHLHPLAAMNRANTKSLKVSDHHRRTPDRCDEAGNRKQQHWASSQLTNH